MGGLRVTRARAFGRRVLVTLATPAGRLVRGLPGLAAMGCAIAGTWLLFGLGWALLVAVPFLMLLDARIPRGR